jgi:predicted SnoaL-like aldol condensation-catalyzing enzyme
MRRTKQQKNEALVIEVFDTLFNKRNSAVAEHYWSPNCIQRSARNGPSREGLSNLIKSLPPMVRYEPETFVTDGDLVMVHERFSHFDLPMLWQCLHEVNV